MKAAAALFLALLSSPHADLHPINLGQPDGPRTLASPDGAYNLIGDQPDSQLLLENTATHQRKLVTGLTLQTATVLWSPDSRFFLVNDRPGSGWEDGYLYDVDTLKPRLDLRKLVLAADHSASATVTNHNTSHAYVHAIGWLDPQHIQVRLNGRLDSDGTPEHIRLGHCFDFRYRVSLTGAVVKVSQRTVRVDQVCGDMEDYE